MTAIYANNPSFMAPPPTQQHPGFYTSNSGMYTPPTSADGKTTSPNQSLPSSPRSGWQAPNHHQQQPYLGPRRQPMGIPAVLRPTEKPSRHSPPKPGQKTAYGSPESLHTEGTKFGMIPQNNVATLVSAQGLSRIVTEEWNDEMLGRVTGAPSRNHWKPDNSVHECDSNSCHRTFGLFERRHHCRRCGNIFCQDHSAREAPLDQHARFHPQGNLNRVCTACFSDFQKWQGARLSRTNSATSNSTNSGTATPGVNIAAAGRAPNTEDPAYKVGSVAQSVPKGWNWSTF